MSTNSLIRRLITRPFRSQRTLPIRKPRQVGGRIEELEDRATPSFSRFLDPHPVAGDGFGTDVLPLSTGNVVITAPDDNAGGTDAGAVYLFNGTTGTLISTLTGSHANDQVGSGSFGLPLGVTPLANGNYLVDSPDWSSETGAVTWASGTTGISGTVSASNSLVGSTAGDAVGNGLIFPLPNGNYIISSGDWSNTKGAVTFGNGATGISGPVSASNSLVGSNTDDVIGSQGVYILTNGNYVVDSINWSSQTGAVTWGSGTTGVSGIVSASNSLVGSSPGDLVGLVWPLTNGNYVITSSNWSDNKGAVTWASGTTALTGTISASNSLVGTTTGDEVGYYLTALTNGNYVVDSYTWSNDKGAMTFGNGTTALTGTISTTNSLVGTTPGDEVGAGMTALTNGNYVVDSPYWSSNRGAATFGNGTTGVTGTISASNSLVGTTPGDEVGSSVTALTNGNYVVDSYSWSSDTGAVTWGSGTTGVSGIVSASNSLVGSTAGDAVGSGVGSGDGYYGVTALTNGNYVVDSADWSSNRGAVTFGNGTTGVTGTVSASNSLVGTTAGDEVGFEYVTALANGNYVVDSPDWSSKRGAVTFGNGTTGVTGMVTVSNSLVGSTAGDEIGIGIAGPDGVTPLTNGNYVVDSYTWSSDTGAVTWGSGTTGVSGTVSAANSLVGSTPGDEIGLGVDYQGVTALADGNYVVVSADWSGATGAVTWGNGTTGVSGMIPSSNSAVGTTTNSGLGYVVSDSINNFYANFVNDNFVAIGSQAGGFAPLIATLSGGNLTIADTVGNNDNVSVVVSGTNYVITDTLQAFTPGLVPAGTTLSNNNNTLTVPMSLVTGSLQFNLGGGNNTLIVNDSGGNFANPISYNGGDFAGATDGLVVQGSGTQSATYKPSGATDGSGTITSAAGNITFSNLTPVDITGMLSLTMAFPNADDVINVANGTDYLSGGTNAALDLTGTSGGVAFEQAAFWDDTNLVIDTTAVPGTDAVTISSASNANGINNFTVTEPINEAGTITVNGATTFPGSINLTAGQSIMVNANITGGTGGTTLLAAGNATLDTVGVTVQSGAVVSATGNGPVTVTGTGGSGSNGFDYGVYVTGLYSMITSGGSGAVTVTGTGGSGAGTENCGVRVDTSCQITSGGGTVQVIGQGGGGGGGFDEGVLVYGGQITSGGSATVTVIGTSSGTGGSDYGVDLESPGEITSGGAGAVTVNGTGGIGSAIHETGVRVSGGTITSGGGDVSVTGQGGGSGSGTGTGSDGSDYGVSVQATGEITSGGAGTVTVMGTAGSEPAPNQIGVRVSGGTITSGGGAVSVTGLGGGSGSGVMSQGVDLEQAGQITSGGSGTVTVSGTGGSGAGSQNYGVSVSDAGSVITSGGGAVSVTATGDANSEAIFLQSSGAIASGSNAPITLTADSLSIDNTSTIDSGTGPTTILTLTAGTLIALGGTEVLTGSPLTLGLSATEIAQVTAGTLTIGNTQTGEVDITTPVAFSSPVVNVTTGSGNAIAFSGTGSLTDSGNVTLTTSGTGAITSTTGATDITVGAGTISLNAGSGGIGASGSPVNVSGTNLDATTSGNGNQFLTAVGSITIDPTGLTAGTGTVELDGGTFTLADNNPINANANLNVNGATFVVGAFSETVNTVTLTSGAISGTTGPLTSTNTFQVQSGTASAILAGANGLTKTTGGTVTLSGADTYGGATTVNGGTLADGIANALPAGTALTVDNSGTFDLVGFPQQVASITGSGNITDSGSAATLTVTGCGNFSGDITGTASLNMTGSSTLTLGGDDTYTGATTISSGTLLVTGNLTESAVSVLPSGTIGGTGTVQGLSISGDLAPGVNGVGTLTAGGDTTFTTASAEFSVQLDGTGPGSSNQLAESGGTVDLGTQTTLVVTQIMPTSLGQTYTIISGAGSITGTFAGLANNATFVNGGLQYRITYTSSTVTLTDLSSVLTPTTLPSGEVGLDYSQTITTVTGSPAAALVVSGVTNSTGLTISGSGTGTITISGVPTSTGTVTFTVTPNYASGIGGGTVYSFTVNPPIILAPAALPTSEVGLAYSQSITASGGSGSITLALSGVTNTTGLTISGNGTGTIGIAGTPTSAGTVTFTVTPTDGIGTGSGQLYSFTVAPPVSLNPTILPGGEVGLGYDQLITGAGGSGTITLAISGITNTTGLTISGSGTGTISLSGTPDATGTVSFTVTPTDSGGTGTGTLYSFTVSPSVVLNPSTLPDGQAGVAYSQTITSTGGAAPVTLAVSGVTNTTGLTISGSGMGTISVSGTPTSSGTVTFTVTPADMVGIGTGTIYSLTVSPAVVLSPGTLPDGQVGLAYEQTITSSGGNGTITLAISGVTNSTGLTISGAGTGTITLSGAPTTSGTVNFTVTPTDAIGTGVGTFYSFNVNPAVVLTPTTLPRGEVGLGYNQSITSKGGSAPVTLSVSGVTNSTGLMIDGNETGTITISGTPIAAGTVSFTVTPSDVVGTGTRTIYSFTVGPAVVLTPATLPAGEVGLGYNQSILATGGTGTVTLSVSGVTNTTGLPIRGSGTGTITVSGTPMTAGTVTFTITPSDAVGTGAGKIYTFTVSPTVILSPATLPASEVGLKYNQSITATGGSAPVTLSVSGVTNSSGLVISGSGTGTITISGTPTAAGTVSFTVTPADAIGSSAGTAYSFAVNSAVVPPPPPPPPLTAQPVLIGGQPNGTVQVDTESNGTYTLQETLTPFGNIPTDVRTAVGDVNGDGIPDYIFATGPGIPFEVAVLSGAPGNPALVTPFDPFLPAPPLAQTDVFTAGGFVSAGDFMDNGRDQIVVSPDQSGGPRIAIYDMDGDATAAAQPYTAVGVNTAEVNPGSGLTRVNNFLSVNPNFRGGARTAVGDLNEDGVPDLAIAAGYGGGPAVLVINGTKVLTTDGFTASDDLIGDFFAFNSSLRDGAYLAIGDVLGNGQQDLILGPGAGGPAEVEVLSGAQIVNDGALAAIANPVALFTPTGLGPDGSGVRVAAAGSGVGDQVNVVVGTGRNMPGLVKVYPGTGFTSGSTSEPTGGQLLDPFGGGSLTDGIFVG